MEFVIVAIAIGFLAWLAGPGIIASARRKAAGDNAEVLFSEWRDWNGDGSVFAEGQPGFQITEPLDFDPPEPVYGVIRIQAK